MDGRWSDEHLDGRERTAMLSARPQTAQRREMFCCAIAFVARESITGVTRIEIDHELVTCDLGQDRGSGDTEGALIAFNERHLWEIAIWQAHGINEQRMWRRIQSEHGNPHRLACRPQDILALDNPNLDLANAPGECALLDDLRELETASNGELFRVAYRVEIARDLSIVGQDDSGGDDWSRETAAANLIDTRDSEVAEII